MTLESTIEAILFFRGEPVSVQRLSEILSVGDNGPVGPDEVQKALAVLEKSLDGRGITLVRESDEVMLETVSAAASIIEQITKEELTKDIGKAGLETLSLVLYHGPITRREIDYVRGVNSSYILRNLMIRGLIGAGERKGAGRSIGYKPTFELLSHLGIKKKEDLPEYEEVTSELKDFKKTLEEREMEGEDGRRENQ